MNHLPKLSVGVTRTSGIVPAILDRGIAVTIFTSARALPRLPGGFDLDNGFELEPPPQNCGPYFLDPTCSTKEARYCPNSQGIAQKECRKTAKIDYDRCLCQQAGTYADGTPADPRSCVPPATGCCEVVS